VIRVGDEVLEEDGPLEVTVERPGRTTIGEMSIDWNATLRGAVN
jgi:hypothetical protein